MSKPANLLASYRSYSYHHVLVIADCTMTASLLAKNTVLDPWSHPVTTDDMGRYAPKSIPNSPGRYCVLINGMTDATFVITRANWFSATAADAVNGDRSTSNAVEGSIEISEPKGVVFLDQVISCCNSLGIDASQAVFVLKTFFVGYLDTPHADGSPADYINDIPPLQFIVYDVTGSFTEEGGMYRMEFVALVNGATRLPQYSKAASAMNFTAGANLRETFKNLEKNINANYDKYFSCVTQTIKNAVSAAQGDPKEVDNALGRVKYIIDVGGPYADRPNDYKVTNQSANMKDTYSCDAPAKFTMPPNMSIESAIQEVMMHCPQVLRDASKGDPSDKNIKYEYKIHTMLISEPIAGTKPTQYTYTVKYYVDRFMRPADTALSFQHYQSNNAETDKKVAENIIEFEYIYTGKNIDILEFDMKVNMGMAYLQTATSSNAFNHALAKSSASTTIVSQQSVANKTAGMGNKGKQTNANVLPRIPIFFGSEIHLPPARNSDHPNDTVQMAYTLAKHASLEMAEAKMKIIGNTKLLGSINKTTGPDTFDSTSTQKAPPSKTVLNEADYKNWGFVPAFAKVKVKMPRNNNDIELFTGGGDTSASADYAVDFWYDGFYYVYAIEHAFEEGEFTQTLNMIGIPQKDIFQSAGGTAPKELTFAATVENCYNRVTGCGPQSTQPGAKDTGRTNAATMTNCNDVQQAKKDNKQEGCNKEATKKQG